MRGWKGVTGTVVPILLTFERILKDGQYSHGRNKEKTFQRKNHLSET